MTNEKQKEIFLVWYDPFFEQWFVCPKVEVTEKLHNVLINLSIVLREVEAQDGISAIKKIKSSLFNKLKNTENNINGSFDNPITGATIKNNQTDIKEFKNSKNKIYIPSGYSQKIH